VAVGEREREVREAVGRLVAAFGGGRLDEYFGSFHPDCSFVFHSTDHILGSVDEYRSLWRRWVQEDGFEVLDCRTSDTSVQLWGDVAVVTHSVLTRVRTRDGEDDIRERETIVLQRQPDGRWLGIHEHLSPWAT
jgi:ketosteroid isomerase-like protein